MKSQKNIKNNGIDRQADSLADLPVAEELAGETRGGAGPHVKAFSGVSGIYSSRDDEIDDIIVGAGPGAGSHIK